VEGQKSVVLSNIATALFFLHFKLLSLSMGGAFEPAVRLGFRAGGAFVVFGCTFTGGYLLRRISMKMRF
jgi:hypothetical protein